jgi:hypothetical protein
MSAMKAALDEIKKIADELEAEGHKLGATLKAWVEKLAGAAPKVEAEVKADAEQVAKDAVAAEAPVAAEAMQDVVAAADHAVTEVTAPAVATTETKTS